MSWNIKTPGDYINGPLTVGGVATFNTHVGIGNSPSAWAGIGPVLQVEQASLLSEASNQLYLTANGYFAGGQWNYINNASADQYYQIAGSHVWRSGIGGAGGTAIGWSTLMTLNSTGLGVGEAASLSRFQARATTNDSSAYVFYGKNSVGNVIMFMRNDGRFVVGSGTVDNLIVTETGNVGIGVTPSAWGSNFRVTQVGQAGSVYGAAVFGYYGTKFNLYNNNTNDIAISTNFVGEYRFELLNGSHVWLNKSSAGTAGVNQTLTQAMTLDASSNLLVATTNASFGTANGFRIGDTGGRLELGSASSTNANIGFDMYSTGAAAYRFYVGWGGTVFATNTTISAISDQRLKENVQDIDVGLGAILALKPRKFDWKAGKGKDIKGDRGFIAQEFEQVFPNLIDEWKDEAPEGEAPYKSVRQDLIPVLVKAIQELAARVQTLETR